MIARVAAAAALGSLAFAACAGGSPSDPEQVAEHLTQAVDANDYAAVAKPFDPITGSLVTPSEVSSLASRMQAFGDLQAFTPHDADAASHRYRFDARFARGTLLVELRLDPDGKVAAYRVLPESGTPTSA